MPACVLSEPNISPIWSNLQIGVLLVVLGKKHQVSVLALSFRNSRDRIPCIDPTHGCPLSPAAGDDGCLLAGGGGGGGGIAALDYTENRQHPPGHCTINDNAYRSRLQP